MTDRELDQILSRDEKIVPSSGFVLSVMEGVRTEAPAAPVRIPWKRVLPGFVAWVLALVAVVWVALEQFARPIAVSPAVASTMGSLLSAFARTGAAWVATALLLSLASTAVSMHIAGRRTRYRQ